MIEKNNGQAKHEKILYSTARYKSSPYGGKNIPGGDGVAGGGELMTESSKYEFQSSQPCDLLKLRYGFNVNGCSRATGRQVPVVSGSVSSCGFGMNTYRTPDLNVLNVNRQPVTFGIIRGGSVKKEKDMYKGHVQYKKEVGERFEFFRQLVLKTRAEFAEEASLPKQYIAQLEWGTVLPGILSIEYFYKEYGLNLSWLVSGEGDIFYKKGPRTPRYAYHLDRILDYRDPEFKVCFEAVRDTGVPKIKEDIIALMKQVSPGMKRVNPGSKTGDRVS
ncbi:MAG: helix-turn-helix transcriptional regulator [bacterium]|nr:helix-turn-helix transcriptional regulator [bacterium]